MGVKRLERQLIMQRSRRLVIGAVATGLLAAGAVTASVQAASANIAGFCDVQSAALHATCTDTHTITAPATVTVGVSSSPDQMATETWTANCTLDGQSQTTSGGTTAETPFTDNTIVLAYSNPDSCTVTAEVTLSGTGTLSVAMTYTTASTPSPTASPPSVPASVHPIKGYAGMCVDDNGNSSALRSKVQIWKCSATDQAQSWTYSNGELKHNSKCANDQAVGGSGSHVILWTCNGASNEKWTHLANGELKLAAHGGTLCLDDPAYSTKDGTQLIVYTCKDSSNQKWSLP
jgi:Ricin-type beta-trefoil lectin domain